MKKSFKDTLQEALKSGVLQSLLETKNSLGEVAKGLGFSNHGRNTGAITIFLRNNNIEFSNHCHKKLVLENRVCPQCGKQFQVPINNKNKSKQITCSHACSGAYLPFIKSRVDNKIGPEATSYPIIAKRAGLSTCCICSESEVVDIHHLDEDSSNNSLDNLVPMCPTHHAYMHRGKDSLIFDKLIEYLDNRKILA